MPPAFVLSQDQTLMFILLLRKRSLITQTSADLTPPPAHPFLYSHNLNQQSPGADEKPAAR